MKAFRYKIFSVFLLLSACVHDPAQVVVIDATGANYGNNRQRYTVQTGDTLYAIAFKFGTSVVDIARLNGIKAPYTIYPKQLLWVNTEANHVVKQPPKNVIKPKRQPSIRAKTPVSPKQTPVTKPTPLITTTASATVVKPINAPKKPSIKPKTSDTRTWLHPSSAPIGKRFSLGKNPHKGIDYHGNYGDDIVASRGGEVVYAGDGLKAYGLLLIIKHENDYISAYAYNKIILVNEGDTVKQGQTIAKMGKKADTVTLHFQIRRGKTSLDPLRFLSE